jgi:hypothetical protein
VANDHIEEESVSAFRVTFTVTERATYEAHVDDNEVATAEDAIAWVDAQTDAWGYDAIAKNIGVDTLDVANWYAEHADAPGPAPTGDTAGTATGHDGAVP